MIDAGGKIETSTPNYCDAKWKIGINKLESKYKDHKYFINILKTPKL